MLYDIAEIPDGITPLVGIRGWRYKDGKLWSCYRDVEWPVGSPLNSECIHPLAFPYIEGGHKEKSKQHAPPTRTCTCGIYALNEWEPSNPKSVRPWPSDAITGLIHGWGHIVLGSKGFRAQYAKPIALVSRPRSTKMTAIIDSLAEVYGIEIITVKEAKTYGYR